MLLFNRQFLPSNRFVLPVAAALALALGGASGCDKAKQALNKAKKVKNAADKVTGKSGDSGEASPEGMAIAGMSKKMNAYAACLNDFARNVGNAKRRYLSWADAKTGPTGKERTIYGLHKINLDPEKRCAAKVSAVANQAPAMPKLEAAAKQYAAALKDVHKVVNDAHRYYKSKAYTKDSMAKGKALHPKLMAAFEAFGSADRDLAANFDRADDALGKRRLAHLEATQGQNMRYHHLVVMQNAKTLFRVARTNKPLTLEDLDAKSTDAATEAFDKSVRSATKYAASHRKEFPTASSYNGVERAAVDLVASARSILKRHKEGGKFTGKEMWIRSGNAKNQVGHPAHLTAKYNALIDASNRLRL